MHQSTDITNRLYDYGRDRPLHLDDAIGSAIVGAHPAELGRHIDPGLSQVLVEGPFFSLAQIGKSPAEDVLAQFHGLVQLAPIDGLCRSAGIDLAAGCSALVSSGLEVGFSECSRCLVPGLPFRP